MEVVPVKLKNCTFITSIFLAAIPITSYAGRPMVVDDAALVSPKSCQLETWMQRNQDNKEFWAVPACNIGGNFELAVGIGHLNSDSDHNSFASLQGKTLIKPLETNDWGIGFSFGTQINTKTTSHQDFFINLPMSLSILDDHFIFHTNFGWIHENHSQKNSTTWGIGTEASISSPFSLTAEIYGNDRNDSFFQTGFRYMLYKDFIQLDASYGNQFSHLKDSSFFSIGFVFLTTPFLP